MDKEAYWGKMMYAEERNAKSREKGAENGLTDEQADALESMARARHNMHTNIDSLVSSSENRDCERDLIRANAELREAGLPTVSSIPLDEDDYINIDSFDIIMYDTDIAKEEYGMPDKYENEEAWQEWYDKMYGRLYDKWEALNDKIENYLGEIDEKYGTSYRPTGATRFSIVQETKETDIIKARAIADGTFMKAPNGEDTNLTEQQWLQVRTEAFKSWFGDWEKTARIEKLKKTKPIEITGEEYKGKYELNRDSAKAWLLDNLRGEYTNEDTKEKIFVSKVGIKEVVSHREKSEAHLKSLVSIPDIIKNTIFIDEMPNEKDNGKYDSYRYYVGGLKIGGEDYTVKMVVGVKNGVKYYDHRLTQIEKGKLIDQINDQSVQKSFTTTGDAPLQSYALSAYKDNRLFSLLQINSSKVIDKNGEPMVIYHGTNKFGFTVFDKEFSDDKTSLFFTDRVDIAKGYAGVNADVRSLYDDDTPGGYSKDEILSMLFADIDISSHTNGWDVANAILPYLTEDIGITAEYGVEDGVTPEEEIGVLTLSSSYSGDTYRLTDEEFSWEKVENWLKDNADLENVIDKNAGIYGVFVNARNVLDIDAGGSMWSFIPKKKVKGAEGVGNMDTRDIVEHAKKLNYDGVYIKDLLDTGGKGYGLVGDIEGDVFISLVDKNQIKSAMDNIGTFNIKNEDIRLMTNTKDMKEPNKTEQNMINETLQKTIDLLKKTGFADVKTGDDFYIKLAEVTGDERYWINQRTYSDESRWDNSGYSERNDGSKASVNAISAEEDGTFSAGNFVKKYGVSKTNFEILTALKLIKNTEWHHTGKSFKETEFYSWADSTKADGKVEYDINGQVVNDEDIDFTPLSEIYQEHKKELTKLAKEYTEKNWEYERRKEEKEIPSFEEYAQKIGMENSPLTEEEDKKRRDSHWYISDNLVDELSSYERRIRHEEVDEHYQKIRQERADIYIEANRERLLEEYNVTYKDDMAYNVEIKAYNKGVEESNSLSNGKEKVLLRIAEIFGMNEDKAKLNVKIYSGIKQAAIRHKAREEWVESQEKELNKTIVKKDNELQAWLQKQVKEGKVKYQNRITRHPDNFIETKKEKYGKYGWYDASKTIGGQEYYSGYEFESEKLYKEYRRRFRAIIDIKVKAKDKILEEANIRFNRPNGIVYGFVTGDTVYLNPDKQSLNTPIHEFGHLWVSQIKKYFPDLWEKGKELFLQSNYLRVVQEDPNYRHLDLDGQVDEAMARAIGDNGEKELNKTLFEKISNWVSNVWKRIGSKFGIENLTSEQIRDLSLQDFTDIATSEMLGGRNLTERINKQKEIETTTERYQIAYHGSAHSFDKFDGDCIGKNNDLGWGYGVYFGDKSTGKHYAERYAEKENQNLYKVSIPEDKELLNVSDRSNEQYENITQKLSCLRNYLLSKEDVRETITELADKKYREYQRWKYDVGYPEKTVYKDFENKEYFETDEDIKSYLIEESENEIITFEEINNYIVGRAFYDELVRTAQKIYPIETQEDNYGHNPAAESIVKDWLVDLGIKGTKYDEGRVIFNTEDIKILEHTRFSVAKEKPNKVECSIKCEVGDKLTKNYYNNRVVGSSEKLSAVDIFTFLQQTKEKGRTFLNNIVSEATGNRLDDFRLTAKNVVEQVINPMTEKQRFAVKEAMVKYVEQQKEVINSAVRISRCR